MSLTDLECQKLEQAIAQLRSDIDDLAAEVPRWDAKSISGTKTYRPISGRITASAKRLDELVRQYTF